MPTPNNQDPIYSYQPLFGSWYIYEQIGKGTFGTVYKIKRQEKGFYAESAVKIITFPSDEYYRDTQSIIGKNKQDLYEFFSSQLDSITREINILHKLRFHPNIVIYEDHQIIQKEDRLSWDILIRMEYLKSLPSYLDDNSLNMRQAVKLGIDILTALSECNKYNIVHRDIKDSNIFITDRSAFKLGDFGIARELSKSASVASFHGTPSYVSPEVVRQEEYDIRSDIYSLGIVMYRLLNNLRIPFAPKYPDKQHPADITNAVAKRLKGEPLKAPINTVMPLSDIVLKACAYSRNDRYASPDDMIKDLDAALAKIDPKLLDRQVTPGEYTEDISGTDHIFIPDKEEEIKEELTDHVLPLAEEEIPQEQPLPVPSPTSWYKRTWAIATFASVFIVILIVSVVFLVKWNLPEETASEATSEASAAVVETTAETTAAATVENETAAAETIESLYKYKIMFSSDYDGDSDIYSINTDGSELKNLTNNNLEDLFPSYSIVNSKIVYMSSNALFTMDIDGSNKKQLTENNYNYWSSCISPNGSKIVFTSDSEGSPELYIMDLDGSNQKRLTDNNYFDDYAKFSPDGNYITFHSDRTGNSEVYIMNSNGTNVKKLTNNPGWDGFPNFSPDGYRIVYTSYQEGNDDIYIMNVDGSNNTRLTGGIDHNFMPAFSPEGNKISFTRVKEENLNNGQGEIYIINIDGSGEIAIPLQVKIGKEPIFITNLNYTKDFIEINSSNRNGVKFIANEDGKYEFQIVGGAFTTYWFPFEKNKKFNWNNFISIFINRSIEWGAGNGCGKEILNTSKELGRYDYKSFEDVEKDSSYYGFDIMLKSNDYIIFIVPDGYDCYQDNYGTIIVNYELLSSESGKNERKEPTIIPLKETDEEMTNSGSTNNTIDKQNAEYLFKNIMTLPNSYVDPPFEDILKKDGSRYYSAFVTVNNTYGLERSTELLQDIYNNVGENIVNLGGTIISQEIDASNMTYIFLFKGKKCLIVMNGPHENTNFGGVIHYNGLWGEDF